MIRNGRAFTASLLLCVGAAIGSDEPPSTDVAAAALIINTNSTVESITPRQAASIFLGRKQQWSSGQRIRLALLDSQPEQASFLEFIAGRSRQQFWSHWRNLVFAGRGLMPKVFKTRAALIDYVASVEGAVGQFPPETPLRNPGIRRLAMEAEVRE